MIMPNWCNNSLTISHKDADTLDNLMAQVRADGDERLFQHIKPMPEELRDTTSPSDSPNWYDWSVDNWGTKWDACSMDYEEYDGIVTFSFDTAWSPPLPVYEALADMGFEVQAYYVEFGMMYAGSWHCNADGEVSEEYSDDISESVPQDVDEEFGITEQLEEWEELDKEIA
jgi:hypothetical protein